jgi:hypothetical protein
VGSEPQSNHPGGRLQVVHGVNRTVVLAGRWAFKLPWGLGRVPVRGWLANRSEWRQRTRPDVCRPRWTLGHVVLVMPRAEEIWGEDLDGYFYSGDEAKADSWGRFGDRWALIDFDRSWDDRGFIGRLYWGNQERLARKWMKLPTS